MDSLTLRYNSQMKWEGTKQLNVEQEAKAIEADAGGPLPGIRDSLTEAKLIAEVMQYQFQIKPLPESEGRGYMATIVELPGCMADGATPEDAKRSVIDAAISWIRTAQEFGDAIPAPINSS